MPRSSTKAADAASAVAGHLQVALDNMPGALVYTDADLNVVFCKERFRHMYLVPHELLEPGRPYTDFLRYLATHGYYGPGNPDEQVSKRVLSTLAVSLSGGELKSGIACGSCQSGGRRLPQIRGIS